MEKVLKKRWSRDSFDFCTLLALLQQVLSVEYRVLTLTLTLRLMNRWKPGGKWARAVSKLACLQSKEKKREVNGILTEQGFSQGHRTPLAHVLKTPNKLCTIRPKEHLLPHSSGIRLWHDGRDPAFPNRCSYTATAIHNPSSFSPSATANSSRAVICAPVASGTASVLRSPDETLSGV